MEILHTPGHTVSYEIEDAVFVGDTLFMLDYGTARADFPGGDAHQLYRSIKRLLALPAETRLFRCHDYKAPGRDAYAWETTVRNSGRRISTSAAARPKLRSSRCRLPATLRWPRRRFCCLQPRSTSAQARFPRRKTTGCAI